MSKWLYGLFLVSTCISAQNFIYPEIGIGINTYMPQSDGIWYQQGMIHHLDLNGRAYMLGLTGSIIQSDDWDLVWHADYINLGHIRSNCLCTPLDANYNIWRHSLVSHPIPVPNAEYTGKGNAKGIKLALNVEENIGAYRIGLEGGAFTYRPQWKESIYGWALSYEQPKRDGIVRTPYRWQLGEVIGLTINHGPITFSLEHYWLPTRFNDKHAPALWTQSNMLMLSWAF